MYFVYVSKTEGSGEFDEVTEKIYSYVRSIVKTVTGGNYNFSDAEQGESTK
jgi:hypothetical protein